MKLWIMGGIESVRFFSDNKLGPQVIRQAFVKFESDEFNKLIEDMQAMGCGAFFSVNRTNGRGATLSDIMNVRSYYLDFDGIEDKDELLLELLSAKLQPSAIVETKRGFHAYWYAAEMLPVNKDSYAEVQRGLLEAFRDHGADGAAKDLARVLRLPGTLHLKDPSDPFMIRIVHQRSARATPYYKRADLLAAFPASERKFRIPEVSVTNPESWLLYLEDLGSWESKPGERNMIMLLSAGVALKFNVTIDEFVSGMLPIVRAWGIGRNEVDELWRVGKWAYAKGTAIPPYVVRGRGVPIRKGL
jgi:hypothetical protein